ncbi:hypothetical protein O181_131568 [Austropuccinia psidii MF-1]|uniref:Tc1-like transposase DDE domain-containing protein n=1 Tax=Austropuccinia psidii MF-1 TaxID=1389203 RepID=A0A9Q3L0R8_9BASI|nr:hypothetical protein [Austropuccinia psidii MF-1]
MKLTTPNGRQCTNSYSRLHQSMAQKKQYTQDGVAGTFTGPNPIENIWKSMKSQISKLYQPQNLDELKHAIQLSWCNIHPGILNDYLRSMPRRMQMVINQHGGTTSY